MEVMLSLHTTIVELLMMVEQISKYEHDIKPIISPSGKLIWFMIYVDEKHYEEIVSRDDFIYYGNVERHNETMQQVFGKGYNRPLPSFL